MGKLNRLFINVAIGGLIAVSAGSGFAHGNERGAVKIAIGDAKVSIEYGRPMLKGRDLTQMIVPGHLWRIGADAPTTLESNVDLDFGGTRVPKGNHVLLARYVEAGKWSLVFSTKSVFQYEPSAKVAEAPLEFREDKVSTDEVTITLTNHGGRGIMEIAWGTMRLVAAFTAAQ